MRFRFGAYTLDTERYELCSGEVVVHLEPQVFDVLSFLAEHRDRVVTKDELLVRVWGSRFVSESTLTSRIKAARRAIGDDGRSQAVIRTVRGRGYRFVAAVQVEDVQQGTVGERGRLPVALGPLIGRVGEVADLVRMLRESRLVTVVGPGGVGKTRIAVEAGAQAAAELDLEVNFIDLTEVAEPAGVAGKIAEVIGSSTDPTADPLALLGAVLRHETRLLVLDNFEHVVAAAQVLSQLLRTATGARMLVTSRERLRLSAERIYTLRPLGWDIEVGRAPAVALFEAAAQRLEPQFTVTGDNEADVRALCRAVDGLPLGIELVAAHVRLLPPGPLRRQFGDRLASVGTDERDVPDRHRTVRDTIDWSFRLLTESQRRFLSRMAVFPGGADLDAIDQVCRPGLDLDTFGAVTALTDKSLLGRRPGTHGPPRFAMLELVREYADEVLACSGDARLTRSRHATYHHDLVRDIEERRWNELSGGWLDLLNESYADVAAAIEYGFAEGAVEPAARTVAGLNGYLHRAVRLDVGARWLRLAMDSAATLAPLDRGWLHLGAGYLEFWQRRTTAARTRYQSALDCFDEAGHDRYRALALVDVAGTWMGDPEHAPTAIAMCEEGVRLSRHVGELPLIAHAVNVLGELVRLADDEPRARTAYEEGLLLARQIDDQAHQAIFEMNLSTLALHRGEPDEAWDLARMALRRAVRTRGQAFMANALSTLAGPELARGRHAQAARLLGAADAGLAAIGSSRAHGDQPEYLRVRAELEMVLGAARLSALAAEGARRSLSEAAAEALSEP